MNKFTELKPGIDVEIHLPTIGKIVSVDGVLNKRGDKTISAHCTVQFGPVQKSVIVIQSDIIQEDE